MCQTPILPHYSAQVPLTYRPSDLHSCRARGGGGHVNTKSKETQGDRGERGEPGLSLTKVQAITAAHRWSMEANCQHKVKSIEEQLIYFGAPQRSPASEIKRSTEDKVEVYLCA